MADQDVRALLLQVSANIELLRSNMSAAERAVDDSTKKMQQHLDDSDKRFEVFGKSLEGLEGPLEKLKALGEFAIGALLGESLIETGKKALEFAGNVKFVSEQVGTSTDFLQKYRFAAGQFGVGTEEADQGLNKFARSIGEAANGNKTLIELFNRLGVNVRDAGGNVRSVQAVFLDTATAISKLDNPAQKSADTLALMGKSAAGLVPLLSAGATGFNDLAAAAQQLGVVLSPELIEHSEEVNHKLAALKAIVDAQMSAAIAQNAGSIEILAGAFVKLAGGIAAFLAGHPDRALTILGALAGARVGGLPGAVIGGIAGNIAGSAIQASSDEDNNDLAFRKKALRDAAQAYLVAHNTPTDEDDGYAQSRGGGLSQSAAQAEADARATYLHQRALYERARSAPKQLANGLGSNGVGGTNDNGDTLRDAQARLGQLQEQQAHASGAALKAINQEIVEQKRKIGFIRQGADAELANSLAARTGAVERRGESAAKTAAKQAEEVKQKNLSDDIAYAGEVRSLREKILAGMRRTATNDNDTDNLQKQGINADADAAKAQNQLKFDKGDFGSDPKIAAARLASLDALVEQNRTQQLTNVDINRQSETVAQQLALTEQSLNNQTTLLQIQDQQATTAAQRRDLELQLLAIQQQQVRAALQKVLDDQKASDADKALAQAQLNALPKIEAAQRGQVIAGTRGPGEQFTHDLDSKDLNEQLQSVKVDGLNNLESGLSGLIEGTKSVKAAFHDMALGIIDDLLKIAIEQAIIKPLANSLFGGSAGGSGFLGSLLSKIGIGGGGTSGLGSVAGGSGDVDSLVGLAAGGSFVVGGNSGIDKNVLSINGQPTVRVGNGERIAVIPPNIPSASRIGQDRVAAMAVAIHVQANDYFDARVGAISGAHVQNAAPRIAAGGASLAASNASRARRRSLAA